MMRYFKCDTLKQEDRKMITQDVVLTEEEKKSDRQGRFLNFLGTLLFFIVFAATFVGSSILIVQIPAPQNPFLLILVITAMLILGFCAFIVSVLIGSCVSSPLYEKSHKMLVLNKTIVFDKAVIYLREYYGWKEPCIVTKCYDSSDERFNNHDVCIFVVGDELRIAGNLKYGFSIRENDLGCYAFRFGEFSLAQIQGENFSITELKSGDTVFHLGRRAKGFIENNFVSKDMDA